LVFIDENRVVVTNYEDDSIIMVDYVSGEVLAKLTAEINYPLALVYVEVYKLFYFIEL